MAGWEWAGHGGLSGTVVLRGGLSAAQSSVGHPGGHRHPKAKCSNTRQVKTPSRQVWRVTKSGWGEGEAAGPGGLAQQLAEKEGGVGGLLLS